MSSSFNVAEVHIGVVGLGLMGSSIVAALLISGHPVKAVAPIPADALEADERIFNQLKQCEEAGLIEDAEKYRQSLTISEDYTVLELCQVVIECVIEDIDIKSAVYQKITSVVHQNCIISSNTSAIPISTLQRHISHPERFLGIHWAEPAFMTRFLEITCGDRTSPEKASYILDLAHRWGKEPTLLKKDIRGFITNRLMYAVYREVFHQIELGNATPEDLDKAFRYDAGSWMTLTGIFRRMDYLGIRDFDTILNNLFPALSNSTTVPELMQQMVQQGARGVHNNDGIYSYEGDEGTQWEEAFTRFNLDICQLADEYSADKLSLK